jgi:hypothetical protein
MQELEFQQLAPDIPELRFFSRIVIEALHDQRRSWREQK